VKEISPVSQCANALRLFFAEVLIHRATHTEHSVSRLQLTGKPADRVGLYRIHREADHFGTLASRALEGALIESAGPGEMRANAIRCLHTGHIGRSLVETAIPEISTADDTPSAAGVFNIRARKTF
jgi:hypothetical protein